MIDIRQTPQYANYLKKIGWGIERVSGINYFIKRLPVLGSVLKIQRPEKLKLDKIWEFAKKYRSFQIIVEPKNHQDADLLSSSSFKLSSSPYLPTKTLVLDLTVPASQLLRDLKKDARAALDKTRGLNLNVSNYERIVKSEAGWVDKSSKNLQTTIGRLRDAWVRAVGIKRYVPSLPHLIALGQSFENNCLFVLAEDKSAGAIFLVGDKTAYYWQAFTNKQGRKSLLQYKIVWEGIRWAKGQGAKVFDFEGIYDERFPNKSWQGFTHFKKSFGGVGVEYPGAFIKNRVPFSI